MKKWILLILIIGLGIYPGPTAAQEALPVLVGHITYVEGQLLRFVPEEQDWVATVPDTPFGLDEALYTTQNSRAEIKLPNRNLIRLNDRTQTQLIVLEEEFTEIDLYSGTARFYHQGSGSLKVYTPFGYVLASSGAVFDLHAREKFAEVLALQGELEFQPAGMPARYRVIAGRPALIADGKQVFTGSPGPEPSWQSWNAARDQAAARYRAYPGESTRYLPPELDYQAPVLDENGRWEQVPYEGETYYFWRPSQVVSGWAPFTVGRWTVWYDDPCWIPAEPFGYVTHHYGNWFFIKGFWYWAPPVRTRVRPHPAPLFPIAWSWYPGRVAWVHHGTTIGWFPLAHHEPYHCRRYWGPRTVVIKDPRAVPVSPSRFQHAHLAVTIPRQNFFAVANYQPFRLATPNRETIARDFQALPVLDRPFLTEADPLRRKHHFTTAAVIREKPRPASLERIRLNQARFQEGERVRRAPEPPSAGPPARVLPGSRPGAVAPTTVPETPPVRKRDRPDRVQTPAPVPPAGKEALAPESRPRTGPESRLEPRPAAPPIRVKDREPEKRPSETFRPAPARPPLEGLEPQDLRRREIPERSKELPPSRDLHRERAPESRPAPERQSERPAPGTATKEHPKRERGEPQEHTAGDADPGAKPSKESVPRGRERSGEGGRGPR
jgi:hypothetical protein